MTLVPPTVTPTEAPATPTLAFTETATPAPAESGDVTATPTLEPTATSTPYTEEGYRGQVQTLVAQVNPIGIAEADIRDIFYYQLLREKVTEAITADLKPEQEQVWARHILVEDEDTAKEIKQRLDDGEDFAAVAAEVSQDTSNKDSGGDLGWFSKGQMDAGFEEAAFSLEVGQISDPVQSAYGWHIIQVLGHEVRPLDGSAFQTYKTQQFNDWLQQAVTDANVQRYDIINSVVPTEPDIPLELQTNG
ncbi:MAG: hypothetical protein GYA17_08985 [Chloroflexi bacterium]|nr:hypothetical protein [Chloroflexota bacterium]